MHTFTSIAIDSRWQLFLLLWEHLFCIEIICMHITMHTYSMPEAHVIEIGYWRLCGNLFPRFK